MIWIRVLMFVLITLLVVYYGCVIGHLLGWTVLTNKRITFVRCLIPFYYWVTDPNQVD